MNTNRLLTSVHQVTRLLSSTVDPGEALRQTLEAAVQAVDASGGSILLHDPESRKLWFHHVIGADGQVAGFGLYGVAIQDDEGIAGQVFQTQAPYIENNVRDNPQHAKRIDDEFEYETRNLITVPLRYPGGALLGVMQLINKREGDFTDDDLTVLDIVASISTMSAENAELVNKAKKSQVMDQLGRVVYDITNKVARISGPVETLKQAQAKALKDLVGSDAAAIREDLQDRLQTISESIKELQRYMDFMTAAVAGKPIEPQIRENDLIAVTERQLTLLEDEAEGTQKVTLKREYDPKTTFRFPFDSFLIERAVFNLVNNALKATPKGGTVSVRIAEEEGNAVLEVRDTGVGMPPYVLARILAGYTVGQRAGGTGLSSKIVREVADAHGGVMEGESAEGNGSTFRLRLPLESLQKFQTEEEEAGLNTL